MSNRNPESATLASVIKQGVGNRLKDFHTAMPGIVKSFDGVVASVQPAIRRVLITDEGDTQILTPQDLPLLINVPVIFPRSGGYTITTPVVEGDEVLLIFNERSIDDWFENGGIVTPTSKRFNNLSDAVAIPGFTSKDNVDSNYDNQNLVIKKDDDSVSIKLNSDGTLSITGDSGITLNGDVTIEGNAQINGTVDSTGNMTSDQTVEGLIVKQGNVVLGTHIHTGVTTGGGTSGPPVP